MVVKTNLHALFAVPFGEVQMPGPEALNARLRAHFLGLEAQGQAFKNPSPSLKQHEQVFESDFTLFASAEPCVSELKAFCWARLGELVAEANGYGQEQMARIKIHSHTWFHITRRGGRVMLHNHPMASWSGVYCVDPGEAPGPNSESGVLRFHNPHFYSNTFLDAGNLKLVPPFHHGVWNHRFKAGQLVMFPSWLPHEVLPYEGERERITVAFNCWFSGS